MPMALDPQGSKVSQRWWFVEIWAENRDVFKGTVAEVFVLLLGIVVDALVFLAMLGSMVTAYALLEKVAYPLERKKILEVVHYSVYLTIWSMFMANLVIRMGLFLLERLRSAWAVWGAMVAKK